MAVMINLQSNYPVLAEQVAAWKPQLREAVERYGDDSIRLQASGGSLHQRELASQWMKLPAGRTWVCASGHQALMATLLAAGLPGKTIAVERLTYSYFLRQCRLLGIRTVAVDLDGEAMLPQSLDAVCAQEKISAIYTMPSLHNPTCAVASLERRQEIAAVARKWDLTILEDGAYSFLVEDEPPHYTQLAAERSFFVESLSKRVVPGLRTCFLGAPEELADQAAAALQLMGGESSPLLTSLGCAMAADGSLEAIIQAKLKEGTERTRQTLKMLAGLEVRSGSSGWHVWVLLPGDLTPEAVELACEQQGVLVSGAQWFAVPGTLVPRAVRLGLGGETEWSLVAEGIGRFVSVLGR